MKRPALSVRPLAHLAHLIPVVLFAASASAFAADSAYEIAKTDAKLAVGATATASLTIKAKGGWHVNGEAPISVALTPPPGVMLKKEKLSRGDLAVSSAESARFDIPVSASETGTKTINAEARFVMCQASACKPVKETVALAVEVTPAAPASGKKKSH